jgi:nicotinamide-nucleotide amidase
VSRAPAVEIVAIGDELLLGDTIDTNGPWLGDRLAQEGILVSRRTVVGDQAQAIRSGVADALARTGTVVCCGGLGPTQDDLTRPVVAALYGVPLEVDAAWVEVMRERFEKRGLRMPASNVVQAEVPRGGTLFPNDVGTAPGLALHDDALGTTVLLPGVPGELRWLTEHHVLGYLRTRLPRGRGPVLRRVLRTTGIAESALAERIADIVTSIAPLGIAFLPVGIGIDLRVTSWGELPENEAVAALQRAEDRLRERLGPVLYGTGRADLAALVGETLRSRGFTVATAESCTGGLLAKRLTDAAGSSDYVIGGIVAYSNEAKQRLLGVPEALLREHGAVSEPVARAMLEGARRTTNADCALSITGIAGPGGGSSEKPVGTVWIGTAVREQADVRLHRLVGSRAEIRERSAQAALRMLLDQLNAGAS